MASGSREAAEALLDHFGILPRRTDQDLLWSVGEAFARHKQKLREGDARKEGRQ